MSNRWSTWALTLSFALVGVEGVPAQTKDRTSLRGLAGVGIIVEKLGGDAGRFALNRTALRVDTEVALSNAGIRVLSMQEYLDVPAGPYLHLNVKTVEAPTAGLHAYTINVDLKQDVLSFITSDTILYEATTWASAPMVGTIASSELVTLRELVKEIVAEFIADFLAANQGAP